MNEALIKKLEDQIRLKDFKLNSLLEITNSINTNQSIDQIRQIFEFILKEQLGYEKFVLFNAQEGWEVLAKVGVKRHVKEIDVENDLLRFKEITVIESSHNELLNLFDVVVPVYHKDQPLAFLLVKGIDDEKNSNQPHKSFNNLTFVQTLTNIIVVAIENKRMAKQSIKQERIRKELEVASEMQKLLFPEDLPSDKRIDLAATYKARHEVGGDYYDFIPLNDDEFIICIADVSGKGISAAMLMANFQATIRTLLNYQTFELDYLVQELNKKVMSSAKGEKFITFFIGHYNANNRSFKYVNAGHNHPILTNGKRAEMLNKGSIGLGMLDELPFIEPDEVEIGPNSTLILYTDGVVELENKDEEAFETNRLIKLIHAFYPLKMEDLNNIVFSKLDEWRGEEPLVDDTAILSCRIF
jgi:sigma-B regulation protein RsbU (phosphoserine phosphatase)